MVKPVTATIAVRNPNTTWLRQTLESLDRQSHPPKEVIIVDNSPGDPASIEGDLSVPVRHIHRPDLDLPQQRALGISAAETELVISLDEDAVLENPTHLKQATILLDNPKVVAVGGRPVPIRENTTGYLAAATVRFAGPRAYFPVHKTHLCPHGRACYQVTHRGSDVSLKSHLKKHGKVVHRDQLTIRTDLPTSKQRLEPRRVAAWLQGISSEEESLVQRAAEMWAPEKERRRR